LGFLLLRTAATDSVWRVLVVGIRDEAVTFMHSDVVIVTILKSWLHGGMITMGPAGDFL
jgi:hypothetical protein